jgi:hypothetical protein
MRTTVQSQSGVEWPSIVYRRSSTATAAGVIDGGLY